MQLSRNVPPRFQSTPPPVSRYNDLVPDDMDRIVAKCLEKDRTERYQTAADLLADLKSRSTV